MEIKSNKGIIAIDHRMIAAKRDWSEKVIKALNARMIGRWEFDPSRNKYLCLVESPLFQPALEGSEIPEYDFVINKKSDGMIEVAAKRKLPGERDR